MVELLTQSQNISEPFYLKVAQGEVSGHASVHKFGAVPQMSNNASGTIWDVNDTDYPWTSWDTAGAITVAAVNAADNGIELTIVGLDEEYEEQTQTVTVSSASATTVTGTWKRVYRAYCTTATNNNDILIQKSGVTVAKIVAGKAQTLMAVYTVPAGYTAYILKGVMSCAYSADATGDMFVRYFGQSSFRVGHSFEVSGAGGNYCYEFTVPVKVPEKSDIDIKALVRTNNARLTAAFDVILVRNL